MALMQSAGLLGGLVTAAKTIGKWLIPAGILTVGGEVATNQDGKGGWFARLFRGGTQGAAQEISTTQAVDSMFDGISAASNGVTITFAGGLAQLCELISYLGFKPAGDWAKSLRGFEQHSLSVINTRVENDRKHGTQTLANGANPDHDGRYTSDGPGGIDPTMGLLVGAGTVGTGIWAWRHGASDRAQKEAARIKALVDIKEGTEKLTKSGKPSGNDGTAPSGNGGNTPSGNNGGPSLETGTMEVGNATKVSTNGSVYTGEASDLLKTAANDATIKAPATVAEAAPESIIMKGAAAEEKSMMGGFKGVKGGIIGSLVLGGIFMATDMMSGKNVVEAAENTAMNTIPLADAAVKLKDGDTVGALKSGAIEGTSLLASMATGAMVGTAVGTVVPVAGNIVGAVVGGGVGIATYMITSNMAEQAWDGIAGLFNHNAQDAQVAEAAPAPSATTAFQQAAANQDGDGVPASFNVASFQAAAFNPDVGTTAVPMPNNANFTFPDSQKKKKANGTYGYEYTPS